MPFTAAYYRDHKPDRLEARVVRTFTTLRSRPAIAPAPAVPHPAVTRLEAAARILERAAAMDAATRPRRHVFDQN